MAKILIVYASDYGNTKKMAEAVAKGVDQVKGATKVLVEAEKATLEEVESADALILGSPVHMGACDWRMKKFIDHVCSKLWMKDAMNGKVGAVFASGGGFGSAGGGGEIALLSMINNLVELGLIIIPLPKNTKGYGVAGLQWGPYGRTQGIKMEQEGLSDEKLVSSHHHGIHVANAALLLKGNKIF